MLQNEDTKNTHDNKSTATATATEASCHQDKPVEVSIIHNRRKATVYSPPKIVHPVHEPRAKELNTNIVEISKQQEDETSKLNYVYFSKISELEARAEVSNCRQFGSPNSMPCRRNDEICSAHEIYRRSNNPSVHAQIFCQIALVHTS
jgi:hypothetical protein